MPRPTRVPNASLTEAGGEGSEGETMAAAAAAVHQCGRFPLGPASGAAALARRELLREAERAELAAQEHLSVSRQLEGIVILRPNPDFEESDGKK